MPATQYLSHHSSISLIVFHNTVLKNSLVCDVKESDFLYNHIVTVIFVEETFDNLAHQGGLEPIFFTAKCFDKTQNQFWPL